MGGIFDMSMSKIMDRVRGEGVRVWRALGYSLSGLREVVRGERSFQVELVLVILLVPVIIGLPVGVLKKVFVIESMVLVLVVELINVAIETGVDYVSEEWHWMAKRIKDVASAGVFICLMNSLGMWVWVLVDFF